MKTFLPSLFALALTFNIVSEEALAVPLLDSPISVEGSNVIIWPDHENQEHFYFSPDSLEISIGSGQVPQFTVIKYRRDECHKNCEAAAVMTTLVRNYETEALALAEEKIREAVPSARFSVVPIISSFVSMPADFRELLSNNECMGVSLYLSQISCNFTLNQKGIGQVFPYLRAGKVLKFSYDFEVPGVVKDGDSGFIGKLKRYTVPVHFGSELLKDSNDLRN